MILPIGDEEGSHPGLPWVTLGIAALCTTALVVCEIWGDAASYSRWGFVPASPLQIGALTHAFLHAGWGHLIGNLLVLTLAVPLIEARWGRPLTGAFLVAAASVAAALHSLTSPTSVLPLVGASGAVAAVMGASLVRFWGGKIQLAYPRWAGKLERGTFWAPVWAIVPAWMLAQLFMAVVHDGAADVTRSSLWSHLGGLVFGVGCAYAVRHWQIEERVHGELTGLRAAPAGLGVIDEAADLRIGGDPQAAFELLRTAANEHAGETEIVSAYWELACELRRTRDAAPQMLAAVKQSLLAGDGERAARTWDALIEGEPTARADRQLLVRLVPALLAQSMQDRAVQALRQIADPEPEPMSAGLAFRVLDLAKDVDPPTALTAARRALEVEDLPDEKRARIEKLASQLTERCQAQPSDDSAAAPRSQPESAGADDSEALSIPLEYDRIYDFSLPSESDGAATAPEVRELDASGSLVQGDSEGELVPDSVPPDRWAESPSDALPDLVPASKEAGPGETSAVAPMPSGPTEDPVHAVAFAASDATPRFFEVKMIEAVPLELGENALSLERPGGRVGRVAYGSIEAIAVAGVAGLAAKSVLVIDLLLNWNDCDEQTLKLIRLRSDAFDVRALMPDNSRAIDGLRALQAQLLARSGAVPLPDRDAANGRPYRSYADVESYQREVLKVEV